ncbi:hypothetical protein B0H11DRAFT_2060571 [Mycena galericulata]|nr:hypothetical protein B0H11DRAFT_2060571 [Mycena galericulata]
MVLVSADALWAWCLVGFGPCRCGAKEGGCLRAWGALRAARKTRPGGCGRGVPCGREATVGVEVELGRDGRDGDTAGTPEGNQ